MMVTELDNVISAVPGMIVIMAYSTLVVLMKGKLRILIYLFALTYRQNQTDPLAHLPN